MQGCLRRGRIACRDRTAGREVLHPGGPDHSQGSLLILVHRWGRKAVEICAELAEVLRQLSCGRIPGSCVQGQQEVGLVALDLGRSQVEIARELDSRDIRAVHPGDVGPGGAAHRDRQDRDGGSHGEDEAKCGQELEPQRATHDITFRAGAGANAVMPPELGTSRGQQHQTGFGRVSPYGSALLGSWW